RQGRQLAGEVQNSIDDSVEERLLAEPVARDEELLAATVVDREGEHALESLDTGGTVFFVGVQDHFRVRLGSETMTLRFEQRPHGLMVVDLAVERNPARPVFV